MKKFEIFLKKYFYFSKSERSGIIALFALLVVLIAIPKVYPLLFPSKPIDIKIASIEKSNPDFFTSNDSISSRKNPTALFYFDPNTANEKELAALGFTEKNISTIKNYLNKSGRFKTSKDLTKIYGIQTTLLNTLIPFIRIKNEVIKRNSNSTFDETNKYKKSTKTTLELNSADSIELVKLYRIGPALAHRILEYREKLGGFISLNQLNEIWGFDEDILYDLEEKINVDAEKANHFNLNNVSFEELKKHPYFKYNISNAIVNYRTQHGIFEHIDDLKKIKIISDSIFNKIILYGFVE